MAYEEQIKKRRALCSCCHPEDGKIQAVDYQGDDCDVIVIPHLALKRTMADTKKG